MLSFLFDIIAYLYRIFIKAEIPKSLVPNSMHLELNTLFPRHYVVIR